MVDGYLNTNSKQSMQALVLERVQREKEAKERAEKEEKEMEKDLKFNTALLNAASYVYHTKNARRHTSHFLLLQVQYTGNKHTCTLET